VRKVLGILVLVLFLGTVFAGIAQAQGYSEQGTTIKSESGMPNEIKPYIIVKRGALPYHVYDLNKCGGSAVQNGRYGMDLVVRVRDCSEVTFNAKVIAAGNVYFLGETGPWDRTHYKEHLKMKSLKIAASNDTAANEIYVSW